MNCAKLPFGMDGEFLDVKLPDEWKIRQVMQSSPFPEIDIHERLKKSLDSPIAAEPLRNMDFRGKRICVVVDDATRPTPVKEIFPHLLTKISERGAENKNITTVIANGTHAPMSDEAIRDRLNIENFNGMSVVNHNCMDKSSLYGAGTTPSGMPLAVNVKISEADFVFSVGTIEPHIMAGFGGGYKNIVPGCAGLETISATHLFGPASERFGNVGRADCAVRKRIEEAAASVVPPEKCFIVNTVLDSSCRTVGLFCGHPVEAHREGCDFARRVWGVKIESKADILLGSSFPMFHDLCQGSKAFASGLAALKNGLESSGKFGIVMLIMRCFSGLGDYCVAPSGIGYEEAKKYIRANGTEKYSELRAQNINGTINSIPFYEKFLIQSNAESLRKAEIFIYTPDIPPETANSFGLFKAFPSMEAMICEARRLYPDADVIISPSAGTCYAYFD